MRIYRSVLAVIGSLGLASLGSAAYAGDCGYGASAQNCQPGVVINNGPAPVFGPMTVNTYQPMGHLRSVQYNRAPSVSITRVHGMRQTAGLSDAPSKFTKGCHPTSTQYCRSGGGTPVNVELTAPVAMPLVQAPVMQAPIMASPMIAAPLPAPRTVYVGGGYDASKFQKRQYGTNDFTPGIAHVPTSFVDRNPAHAQHALNVSGAGGIAPGQGAPLLRNVSPHAVPGYVHTGRVAATQGPGYTGPRVFGNGILPHHVPAPSVGYSVSVPPVQGRTMNYSVSVPPVQAPAMGMSAPVMSAPVLAPTPYATAPVQTSNGLYASNVAADGTYWEKTSGPTFFGDTLATQVICKRKLPQKVVRPVVGVPTPVVCETPQPHHAHKAKHKHKKMHKKKHGHQGPVLAGGPRWSY